ncbi:MAG: hypothetical protein QW639_00575 [Candidatus Bathyarchaeia archaeon]
MRVEKKRLIIAVILVFVPISSFAYLHFLVFYKPSDEFLNIKTIIRKVEENPGSIHFTVKRDSLLIISVELMKVEEWWETSGHRASGVENTTMVWVVKYRCVGRVIAPADPYGYEEPLRTYIVWKVFDARSGSEMEMKAKPLNEG